MTVAVGFGAGAAVVVLTPWTIVVVTIGGGVGTARAGEVCSPIRCSPSGLRMIAPGDVAVAPTSRLAGGSDGSPDSEPQPLMAAVASAIAMARSGRVRCG